MSSIHVRPARREDAAQMAALLNEIIEIGGTTAMRGVFDVDRITWTYLEPPRFISCFVALEPDGRVLGFQALEWPDPDWPDDFRAPPDWGIIASFVAPSAHGQGVGRALFAETARAAKSVGAQVIDATIRRENTGGQAFYGKLGFDDYRSTAETVSKRYPLSRLDDVI